MANPEHLEILKQGTEAWNKWRKENPNIRPDLTESSIGFPLTEALRKIADADWMKEPVGLVVEDLCGVDLRKALLSNAVLYGINLFEAKMQCVNLEDTLLINVHLVDSSLKRADLNRAKFSNCDLSGADLRGVSAVGTDFGESDLRMVKLMGANLDKAMLAEVDFWKANLEKSNLNGADLRYCRLVETNLSRATLTGAKLYGTSRDDWIISDVKCDYIYWDEEAKQKSPKDRDLEPGEFERLYAALPTIEYIFEKRMTPIDPLIMDRVVQAIREKKPEFDIKIDSINARGLAPSIKFTVQHEEHKEPALEEVRKGYDERIDRLEAEKGHLYELLGQAIDKAGVKLITAGPGAIVATDGSTINIQQHIHNALELQKTIADEPEKSKSFAKTAKKTALDIIGGAIKDIAKGQVKEAAKEVIELGKDLGPIIVKTAAYGFFKSML